MPAHRIRKRRLESGVEMDMTPMIDIVFLLIAFFMIVSDLSNLNIQHVILPEASEAKVPKKNPGDREIIINIILKEAGKSEVRFMGNEKGLDAEELTTILKAEALAYDRWEPNPSRPEQEDSLLQVLIRCDEGADSGAIHTVYKACQAAKIFRVKVGALSERSGNPYLPE